MCRNDDHLPTLMRAQSPMHGVQYWDRVLSRRLMSRHVICKVKVHVYPRITSARALLLTLHFLDHVVFVMSAPSWADSLTAAGLYYDGIIDESKLQDTLELHKRDTVSTFGTRSSRRVSKGTKKALGESQVVNKGQCDQPENSDAISSTTEKENVNPHASMQGTVQVNRT